MPTDLLQDLDHLPTLDEESLDQTELAVIKDWTEVDPDLKAAVEERGPEIVGMAARRHVALKGNLEIQIRARNPRLHPLQVQEILDRELAALRPDTPT